MTLTIYQIVDMDCIVSLSPLILDQPSPTKYAYGVGAILRRVLYGWCRDIASGGITIPLPALEGTRWTSNGLMRYRNELEGNARGRNYVAGASVPLQWDGVRLSIYGQIALVDGNSYALEVSTVDAPAAILAFGTGL